MEPRTIRLKTLLSAFFSVLLLETAAGALGFSKTWPLSTIGALRILEIAILIGSVALLEGNIRGIGVNASMVSSGIKRGTLWSIAFAMGAAVFSLGLLAFGIHPLALLRTRLPDHRWAVFIFFWVGGIIGPVAEEIFFRGIIYSYFRRFGIIFALAFSTFFFTALHTTSSTIPIPQFVGGILFAVSFEVEKNLFVPIVIHILGNLAIFSISLLYT